MFTIDYDRAKTVFDSLILALRNRTPPFHGFTLPQHEARLFEAFERGSLMHERVLFAACNYMRGGQNSDTAMRMFAPMYAKYPEIFAVGCGENPHITTETIRAVLVEHNLTYKVDEVARFWLANFAKLDTYWEGSPSALFRGTQDFDVFVTRIKRRASKRPEHGFYGFQEKMIAMLAYFLMDAGFLPEFPVPTPIDFHNGRVLIGHEIIVRSGENAQENFFKEQFKRAAREVTLWYIRESDVLSRELADVLWLLSRTFCRHNPANISSRGKYSARSTVVTKKSVVWSSARIRTYERTCLQCPVQSTCTFAVPSAHYYVQGKLVARDVVAHSPQERLFTSDVHAGIVGRLPVRAPAEKGEQGQAEDALQRQEQIDLWR